MRGAISVALLLAAALRAAPVNYNIVGDDPGPWPRIFESVGLRSGTPASLFVIRAGTAGSAAEWKERIAGGAIVVLEGDSGPARELGFRPAGGARVSVRSLIDERAPTLRIVWEKALELDRVELPAGTRVFAKERWTGMPVMAGTRAGSGAVLWLAVTPGERGYERFPYLLQALADLGLDPGIESRRLWAFFDSSYRLRVDVDYMAERWRRAGIAALHVAAWHYNEPDPQRDEYLQRLIEACHRRAILVYAWIELPHVSERFWEEHPEWREKTATGQDAHLDWRKLMNLQNADCRRAVLAATRALLNRFDWDGANIGELYFESLEGASNPARFTPFNDDVRHAFREKHGVDARYDDPRFLAFRVGLVREMQQFWVDALDAMRRESKPHLDLVLTHVDDRFDTNMREAIGADAAAAVPMAERRGATFLVEDPATVWHLGPERYTEIAKRYAPLAANPRRIAIDVNIVERYQAVYPTKQQTGTEFFQLVHEAVRSFERVALYFENSIAKEDLRLLPAAASHLTRFERIGEKTVIEAPAGVRLAWSGPVSVNGKPWPFSGGGFVMVPRGAHVLEAADSEPRLRVLDFNGDLLAGAAAGEAVEFSYESQSRALARLSARPVLVEVDGDRVEPEWFAPDILVLPRGQHIVTLR